MKSTPLSQFFIERPVFATVLSIVIVLSGLVSALILPVAQYPEIAPPTVTVTFWPFSTPVVVPLMVNGCPFSVALITSSTARGPVIAIVGAAMSTLIGLLACVAGLPALSLTSAVTDTEPVVGSSPTASAGTVTHQALSDTVAVRYRDDPSKST